jgi:acyl-CoA synthetase (NDP forming)
MRSVSASTSEGLAPIAPGLASLFSPRGVLVVGASNDPQKLGGAMASRLRGYAGPVALVNSRGGDGLHETIAEAVAAVRSAGGQPDLAVLCVPAAVCPDVVRDCGQHGVRAVLVCAGGFAEAGPDGAALQARLLAAARTVNIRVLGPNTSGFFVPGRGLFASFVPGVADLEPGQVAVLAASGGLNHALAFAFQRDGIGLSLGVGIGAGVDVTAVDVLHYLAEDTTTTAIALHLENVTDGLGLLHAVRRTVQRKPVVALLVGQHDVGEFAQSHTGALATSWRTARDLLRQAGAVLVERADDLVVATGALSSVRLPSRAYGVGLVTAQAGPGLLIADSLHDAGICLPPLSEQTQLALVELLPPLTYQANPVDTGRPGAHHAEVLRIVAADPGIDLLAVYGLVEHVVDLPAAAAATIADGHTVVVGVDGTAEQVSVARAACAAAGVPITVGADALTCAVSALVQDAARYSSSSTAITGRRRGPHWEVGEGPWTESQAKEVLSALGVPVPARRVCREREAAHAALAALGGPVAVKVSRPDILHKSDVGGVHLGIRDHEGLDAALTAFAELSAGEVLVEQMAPDGIDLIAGARRDPVFGPIVVLGVGGIATEIYADVAIASVPASHDQLRCLPTQLRARALLEGFRGQPALDRDAIADVLETLGDLLLANDHLTDVEINPLRCTSQGLLALDAVLVAGKDKP